MKITPLFDRIVVEPENEKQTDSGIFLGKKDVDGPKIGTVIKVPEESETPDGKNFKLFVKEGDKVLYNKYAGAEAVLGNKTVVFIRQTDILAIL
ncbi:MAG: co-chaperone GroES [Clostridia bacterium]|nr:co-chaperone GroES [Clostridia bacterium]